MTPIVPAGAGEVPLQTLHSGVVVSVQPIEIGLAEANANAVAVSRHEVSSASARCGWSGYPRVATACLADSTRCSAARFIFFSSAAVSS